MYVCTDKEGKCVRPGNTVERIPPSFYYDGNIETQNERNRYEVSVCFAVKRDFFKVPRKQQDLELNICTVEKKEFYTIKSVFI